MRSERFYGCLGLMVIILGTVLAQTVSAVTQDQLYGPQLRFDIYRKASKVGEHIVDFRREGAVTIVRSQSTIEIKLLFLTAYYFRYESVARWRGDQMQQINVRVDDNGSELTFDSVYIPTKGYRTRVGKAQTITSAPLFPTNHWHIAALRQSRLLNTLTGEVAAVRISPVTTTQLKTPAGPIEAGRYDISGGVETSLWYDRQGRWVGMRFIGRDGTPVEYRCQQCESLQPTAQNTVLRLFK